MRVTVVGAGYVGLVTAAGLASLEHEVVVVEAQPGRLEAIRAGRSPIHEAGLEEALRTAAVAGRLKAQAAPSLDDSPEVVFVCVGTPIDDRGQADLRQLGAALTQVKPAAGRGAAIVVRSTLPVGSTREALQASGLAPDRFFTNPEFLRQGTALDDFMHPTRIIVGKSAAADPAMLDLVLRALSGLRAPLRVVSLEEAEIIKNGANAFLALKLSFANEMAGLAERYGADIEPVLDGISLDPRIGPQQLRPSFGFGGSCLPKELQTVALAGIRAGLEMHVTSAAAEANAAHQRMFADRIDEAVGGASGKTIALLGLAFKAGTDDVRSSPALRVARFLIDRGAIVRGHDPVAGANAAAALPQLLMFDDPREALRGAHACVITTEWPEYRDLDWPAIRSVMARPVVVDGRRLLDPAVMEAAGYEFQRIGSPRT